MYRHDTGSRRDPLLTHFDRHSRRATLHEAKLAAWAFAIGEAPGADHASGRAPRRGMLPDVLPPEWPPPSRRRPLLGRLAEAFARWWGHSAPEPAHEAAYAALDIAAIAHFDRRKAADVPAAGAGVGEQPLRSRAA